MDVTSQLQKIGIASNLFCLKRSLKQGADTTFLFVDGFGIGDGERRFCPDSRRDLTIVNMIIMISDQFCFSHNFSWL